MGTQSQAALLQQLRAEPDPDMKGKIALELLAVSIKREMVDAALAALERCEVTDSARPILREKAAFYFENPDKDKGGLLREKLIRLLMEIGHPDDQDMYVRGLNTYERQMGGDVTQTLRAAGLVGLAMVNRDLARVYAVKLLGEPDTSPLSGQPSMAAINVLVEFDERLPIYGFIVLAGRTLSHLPHADVVAKAFESLGDDFPAAVFREAALPFVEGDVAVVVAGIISPIIERRLDGLYDLLEQIVTQTHSDDLHRFAGIALAASRDESLTEMLYRLAGLASGKWRVLNFIEAVELTAHPDREALLKTLRKRRS